MKKMIKKIFILLLVITFLFPIVKVFAYFDEGDSTIFMRVPDGNGCYYVETEEASEKVCGTRRFFVSGGTEVVLRAEPNDGYHLLGWYHFEEVDSDGQGTMTYPLEDEPESIENSYVLRTEANGVYNLAPVFAEGREIEEIRFTGEIELETLEEGELPEYTVTTTTEHVTIEAYGSNTNWAKLPSGYENWSGFGTEEPTAEADGTFYAMRLAVHVDDGYVIKPTTRIFYNDRDMYDTYTSIMPYEWGGYVFLDFGQVFSENPNPPEWIEPEVVGNTITRISVNVDLPRVGDEIAYTENGHIQTPQADVHINEEDPYRLNQTENNIYMYYFNADDSFLDGAFEKGKTYKMNIWLVAREGFEFAENVQTIVNGTNVRLLRSDQENVIGLEYMFEPEEQDIEYTIESGNGTATATFNFAGGHTFTLDIIDILTLTTEQIEEGYNMPAEYIEQAIALIKDKVKTYGDLLSIYAIEIEDHGLVYSDGLTLRIKMTDAMKKYNSFKFIFLDETHDFDIQEAFNVTMEGDYLIVELPHLSAYALVGNTVSTNSNPKTGDKIIFYSSMLGLSLLGLLGTAYYTKKKYFS